MSIFALFRGKAVQIYKKYGRTMETHRIYFEKRCMTICPPTYPSLSDANAVVFQLADRFGIHELIDMFEMSDSLRKVYIPTPDVEQTYQKICAEFVQVCAGGGLVSNRRGDYLMINRNGLWDLPKGHQEAGETIQTCALREVQEETGVDRLILRELICVTDHCYRRNGLWHLKHTWWFDMLYNSPADLTPQREEDISKAAWVPRSSLAAYLQNSFPSIVEVFRERGV